MQKTVCYLIIALIGFWAGLGANCESTPMVDVMPVLEETVGQDVDAENEEHAIEVESELPTSPTTSDMEDTPTPEEPSESAPPTEAPSSYSEIGVWERVEGDLYDRHDGTVELRALVFDESGGCTAYLEYDDAGMIACIDGTYEKLGTTSALLMISEVTEQPFGEDRDLISLIWEDEDQLRIVNLDNVAVFERKENVAPDFGCRTLSERRTHEFDGYLYRGLALSDGLLWMNAEDNVIQSIDPDTGALGNSFYLANQLIDMTDDGVWVRDDEHFYFLREDSAILGIDHYDYVDENPRFRAIAGHPDHDLLYLLGEDQILSVSDAPPFALSAAYDFDFSVADASFDGSFLWVLGRQAPQAIVRLDPTTMDPLDSYRNPDPSVYWRGIEVTPSFVFLVGIRYEPGAGYVTVVKKMRHYDGDVSDPSIPTLPLPF